MSTIYPSATTPIDAYTVQFGRLFSHPLDLLLLVREPGLAGREGSLMVLRRLCERGFGVLAGFPAIGLWL